MRVSKKDLENLKGMSETLSGETINENISSRASVYLAIETIHQMNRNTRNNILFTILGAVLGFLSSLGNTLISEDHTKEEIKQLNKQLLEVKTQLSNYQKYHPKKDSLQISSKKE